MSGVSGRFWEHTIPDDGEYAAHIDNTHFNTVKHGLAASAADWPFSSFRSCVGQGLYPANWAEDGALVPDAGERG